MKKILAIISIAMAAAVFAFAGCQKQEAKSGVQSAPTATAPMSSTTGTTAAAPGYNK